MQRQTVRTDERVLAIITSKAGVDLWRLHVVCGGRFGEHELCWFWWRMLGDLMLSSAVFRTERLSTEMTAIRRRCVVVRHQVLSQIAVTSELLVANVAGITLFACCAINMACTG